MERYNYFYIIDCTNDVVKYKNPYISFLIEVEKNLYHDAFYFYNIQCLLIRTKETADIVRSNMNEFKDKSCRQQKIPYIYFEMQNANDKIFPHPENDIDWITAEELYAYFAKKYFDETGIDFLKD